MQRAEHGQCEVPWPERRDGPKVCGRTPGGRLLISADGAPDGLPLDAAALPAAADKRPLFVGVSGGADSFALLHALLSAGHPVHALTVDHGLRRESAEEAQTIADWCADHSVPHTTLLWHDPQTGPGLQAAARTARYGMMVDAVVAGGGGWLVTGHTMDDQAETVLMRLRRGSGLGLRAMAPTQPIAAGAGPAITLGRPMLRAVRRADARAYARYHGLPFFDDPSNEDQKFERVQMRVLLTALAQRDVLTVPALCSTAQRLGAVRDVIRREAMALNDQEGDPPRRACGAVTLHPASESVSPEALAFLLSEISGHPLDGATLNDRGIDPYQKRFGAFGVMGMPDGKGGALLFREPAALLGRADGSPGIAPVLLGQDPILWDDRWRLSPPDANGAWTVEPLGRLFPEIRAQNRPEARILCGLPVLTREGALTHLPEGCDDFVRAALAGWNDGEQILNHTNRYAAAPLLAERLLNDVIRYPTG